MKKTKYIKKFIFFIVNINKNNKRQIKNNYLYLIIKYKKIQVEEERIQQEKLLFAEMLTNSNEKIFLEAIDQFFEQDSPINYIESPDLDLDIEIEKMNDKFCDSLDEGDCGANLDNITKDNSTEFDSEDASSHSNSILGKKKLFMNNFLIINQENIYNAKNKVLKDYCSKLQMIEQCRNVWREKEM